MDILFLWSFLRILISLTGAAISNLRPLNILEKSIAVWPPAPPWMAWLERVFVSPLFRWDANIYVAIADKGPSLSDGTASFHPLYPLLARPFMLFSISAEFSLLLISSIAGIGFIYCFNQLARLDMDLDNARTSQLLLLFSPLSFLLFVPYSEALFLLLATISLLYCRKKKWGFAGIAGGLAALTRQQGIFLVFPLVWELWEESQGNFRVFVKMWKSWIGVLMIPLFYASWVIYRGLFLNDVSFDFTDPIEAIYSILLSPSHTQVVPHFRFLFPWQAISLSIEKIRVQPDVDIWTNIILGSVILLSAIIAWPRLRNSYRLFILVNFLVALSYYTGEMHPYMGMPRHMWLAFPIYLGIGQLVQKPWMRIGIILLGLLSMSFLLILYVLEAWVP